MELVKVDMKTFRNVALALAASLLACEHPEANPSAAAPSASAETTHSSRSHDLAKLEAAVMSLLRPLSTGQGPSVAPEPSINDNEIKKLGELKTLIVPRTADANEFRLASTSETGQDVSAMQRNTDDAGIIDDNGKNEPSGSSPGTGDPPEDDYACFAAFNASGSASSTISTPDLPPNHPSLFLVSYLLMANWACGGIDTAFECVPQLKRNDGIANAGFSAKDGVIRYNWSFLSGFGPIIGDENRFAMFLVSVLAHEYGHYVNSKLRKARSFVESVDLLKGESLTPRQKSELFADSMAGCLAGYIRVPTDSIVSMLVRPEFSGSNDDYPRHELRRIAIDTGADRCKNAKAPIAALVPRPSTGAN